MITTRFLFGLGTGISAAILGLTYVLEYGFDLEPCTLCLLERWLMGIIVFFFGIAALHHPRRLGIVFYSFILGVLNLLGCLTAIRHLWLQYAISPNQIRPCSADLKTLLQFKPLTQVLSDLFIHTQDCSVIHRILGIPLSVWSFLSFLLLGTLSIFILIRFKIK